ncbi:hypothetical protein D3C76_932120 [compost metagenome]
MKTTAFYLILTFCLDPTCTSQQVARPETGSGAMTWERCQEVRRIMLTGADGQPPLQDAQDVTVTCEPAE